MEKNTLIVQIYKDDMQDKWDHFVMEDSVNGTFLQTRRFLNYHPKGRFLDASYLIYDSKKHLIAVCPACAGYENEERVFISHQGSTFGGIIIGKKYYKANQVIEVIDALEARIQADGFQRITYRITSDIFSFKSSDLLQYCLYYRGYAQYDELNLYVDLNQFQDDILSNFNQMKRRNVHNCEKAGLFVSGLESEEELGQFYQILCHTLEKYGCSPVHSLTELMKFKYHILKAECGFYGVFLDHEMIAGAMMFYFHNVNVAHTQYLCAKREFDKLSPMSYLYYMLILEMRKKGFDKLCWGTASEHLGQKLNFGLTRHKEGFGSRHTVNRIYEKAI